MSKVFKVSIVTILLTAGSFFYIKLNLKFLFDYNVKKYVNYNFQGIECIDEELYLISNLDHKIYKLSEDLSLLEILDTLVYYKGIPMVHFTSFYIKDSFFFMVNSYNKINGFKIKADLEEIKKKNLQDINYSIISLDTKSNHVEFSNSNKLLFFDQSKDSQGKSKLIVYENNVEKCSLTHNLQIQNMVMSSAKDTILILDSFISHYFGLIYHFNVNEICKKNKINFMNAEKIDLIVYPYYELEGYASCKNKKIYIFINKTDSYLYLKKI